MSAIYMVVPASKHVSQHHHFISTAMKGLSGRYLLMHGTGIHTTAAKATKFRFMLQLPGADAGKPDVKGAAEKAVKKSPLGFMNVGELAFDLPGSGVSKDDLPNNVKPGDAAGLPKGPTAKPPSLPNLPKVCTDVHGNCYVSTFWELGNDDLVLAQPFDSTSFQTNCFDMIYTTDSSHYRQQHKTAAPMSNSMLVCVYIPGPCDHVHMEIPGPCDHVCKVAHLCTAS